MVRWSSSAFESIRAGGLTLGPPDQFAHSWVARPGLITGSPWPRLAFAALIGLPFSVLFAWALAWGHALMGRTGVMLAAVVLCALALALVAFCHHRRAMRRGASSASPGEQPTLRWQGPWPGEPAAAPQRLKPARQLPRLAVAIPASGFTWCGGVNAVQPRLVLSCGGHVCVDVPGQGWHWLQLGATREDRALKTLLNTLRPSGNPLATHGSVPHVGGGAGGARPAVASSGRWEAAVARRRQAREVADAPPDTFPPTAIMHRDPGDPLEPSAAHGPA